ncbi:hypothetical protein SAMN04487948_114107 [Halogranum amylolyticum]|uniref:Uncharacterized protein n=1 Tax=Halogranum amylolyticum TaxID=660520 RepID=A0A1H8V6Z2_9EURY|nr:hypothetical protein [Halogranum amylolyticum]SEP11232.1 hypothetical protein SAMN04487948_114107 [Halogranum amylolyticum]
MVDQSEIETEEVTDDYYRFRIRDDDQFESFADTPEWAEEIAETVTEGAAIQMGSVSESDALRIRSVRVPKKPNLRQEGPKDVATRIVEKVRS